MALYDPIERPPWLALSESDISTLTRIQFVFGRAVQPPICDHCMCTTGTKSGITNGHLDIQTFRPCGKSLICWKSVHDVTRWWEPIKNCSYKKLTVNAGHGLSDGGHMSPRLVHWPRLNLMYSYPVCQGELHTWATFCICFLCWSEFGLVCFCIVFDSQLYLLNSPQTFIENPIPDSIFHAPNLSWHSTDIPSQTSP